MGKRQLTIHELLEDPHYAKWITLTPKLTVKGHTEPWVIYARRKKKGPWSRGKVETYEEALAWLQKHLDDYYDIVISSRRQAFKPPVIRSGGVRSYWPTPPGHVWCTYCRRPTKFAYFVRHHAIPARYPIDEYTKRCSVCGIRLESIKQFNSKLISRWAQPKVKKGKK